MNLFVRKSIQQMVKEGDPSHVGGPTLSRTLNGFNLMMLGVGGIIGAGIFTIIGTAAANYAGPAIVYSFIISGILCALAGLCYAELAAMVPVAGSAYAYSYATMGELIAWIIGWDLILEYAFGAVTVSIAWSGYLVSLLTKTLGVHFSDSILLWTKGPWEQVTLSDGTQAFGIWNVPASLISLTVAGILYRGIKESAWVNNIIVVVKVAIVLAFIILGWGVIDSNNLIADASATGLGSLIPPVSAVNDPVRGTFDSFGWAGVMTAAGIVFFAYIGFDAVSTTAQETRNPQKDLPVGILGSLAVCTVLYVLISFVMTGVVNYTQLNVPDPLAVGIDKIVELRSWSPGVQLALAFTVKLGALAGITSVILVLMLGQTRVFFAMAKDGLLPFFDKVHSKFQTPSTATAVTGVGVALAGGVIPLHIVGELVSIGTLLAFVLVCVGVIILRKTQPNVNRPFKVPFYYIVAPAGALACLWVMSNLPHDTWVRLAVWMAIGIVFYFVYGIRHSRLRKGGQ